MGGAEGEVNIEPGCRPSSPRTVLHAALCLEKRPPRSMMRRLPEGEPTIREPDGA